MIILTRKIITVAAAAAAWSLILLWICDWKVVSRDRSLAWLCPTKPLVAAALPSTQPFPRAQLCHIFAKAVWFSKSWKYSNSTQQMDINRDDGDDEDLWQCVKWVKGGGREGDESVWTNIYLCRRAHHTSSHPLSLSEIIPHLNSSLFF